ncbi:23S rRNA (uracil(1939)-C(5))-methyltransferase RlmD [Bacillus solimangrovi]|uniref:23S rRNA (Uracil-5-)-methyltransferase RumA n=1 Tax=Bacillus solimangrovi TaxID=1305675 RepID=A0A1E5LH35_9BACI|nr:23S rRNA (uracil(1939)-C(5))-methyltransferase RlmD [Bacillus solimangrovi]OEH93382.1 23S rRNA (uracil-5-)-methyltransferase RumA [Bacillus solimangrovi]
MTRTATPVQKNDKVFVTFEDLTHDGAGVAKVDGYPLFVPYGLPGERAEVLVTKTKKNYGFGKIETLIQESPDRVEPPCPIYRQCGGCQLQHMTYEAQLDYKQKHVEDVMKRIGHLSDVPVHPVIGMDEPWNYRNKAQVPVGERNRKLIAGFYQKRSHYIIDMESCMIQQEANDIIIQSVKRIAERLGIRAYDEKSHRGTLRHIMTRTSHSKNEVMLVLITKNEQIPHKNKLIDMIKSTFPQVVSIVQNVNPKQTNVIFGNETKLLWGEEYLFDTIGDVKFAISARSFYQVNPIQTKVLYNKALEYAQLTGEETVIDAYCGIGTISLFLAQKAKKVYGVEIIPEAIEDAERNAKLNNIENVQFATGEAETVIPKWFEEGVRPDVIVVDPPRKGCEESLLQTILEMKPKRIVYVSCSPATLARDLKILEEGDYQTKEIQPVDMFPQTMHCEAVAMIDLI